MTPHRMAERGITSHILPSTGTADDVVATGADAVFLANGPGDPAAADAAVETVRELLRREVPIFGICFGNQVLGRAFGFGTYKLGYGHRGINQPVQDRSTGKVEITAHNHGFAVDAPLERADRHRVRRGRGQSHLPQRQRRRGAGRPGRQGLQRAVPPRGRGRPARRRLPLRPVRRAARGGEMILCAIPRSDAATRTRSTAGRRLVPILCRTLRPSAGFRTRSTSGGRT